MGSDNGLDRIDWEKPFHPVAAPPPIHWHHLLDVSPVKHTTQKNQNPDSSEVTFKSHGL